MESQSHSRAQYEAKLEALHQHANNLADASSIEDIEEHTVEAMETTLGFSWVNIGIVEGNLITFTLPKSRGGSGERWQLSLDGPGVTVRAVRTGESQLISDIRKDVDFIGKGMDEGTQSKLAGSHPERDERTHSLLVARAPALSELDVPVKIGQSVVAVIGAESTELDGFTKQDQKLLETLASHVASAIHRIRLLEAQLQYEAKLEALHKHANELAGATTIGEIAENTIESMYATLGMKSCDFLTVEDDHLRLIDYRGWIPSDPDQKFPLDGLGILVKAANTKQTILLPDVREDSSYVEYVGKEAEGGKKYQPLSELCVPVISGGEVVAVLNTESNQLDFYDARDQVLLETLASHVASAIQRIKYREGMRDLAYKLNNLEPGGCYLSESHERCLKAYAVLSMENVPGLCVVREDPQRLVEGYGIKREEIVLLSSRPFDDWETIDDLQLLSRTLSRFLESGEGVVLLDGLEYLITRFGFEVVYSFIQEKRFDFLRSKTVLLVPVEMRTLDEHQQALLSSEFTVLK